MENASDWYERRDRHEHAAQLTCLVAGALAGGCVAGLVIGALKLLFEQ